MKLSWKTGVALVVGGILLGGSLSAMGQDDGGSTDEVKAAHFRGPGGGPPHFMGRGLVRSQTVVQGEDEGTFNTHYADAGELKAVDGNTLSIEEADGTDVRIVVDDDTAIRRDREEAEVGDLEVGDHVFAHRLKEGDGRVITKHIFAISAERWAEMEEQRAACTDDDESTECERPMRGPRGRGGMERVPEAAVMEETA